MWINILKWINNFKSALVWGKSSEDWTSYGIEQCLCLGWRIECRWKLGLVKRRYMELHQMDIMQSVFNWWHNACSFGNWNMVLWYCISFCKSGCGKCYLWTKALNHLFCFVEPKPNDINKLISLFNRKEIENFYPPPLPSPFKVDLGRGHWIHPRLLSLFISLLIFLTLNIIVHIEVYTCTVSSNSLSSLLDLKRKLWYLCK